MSGTKLLSGHGSHIRGLPMRVRLALLAFLPLLLAGCFDDPVNETLVIQMLGEDKAAVTATVTLQTGPKEGPLLSRLQELKRDYLIGQDPWTRRFERARAEHEERTISRDRNKDVMDVSRVKHLVVIPREDLAFLLGDSGVTIKAFTSGGEGELLVVPGGGSLASTEQRRVLRTHLEAWSVSATTYFIEVSALYDYLSTSPDRAPATFAHLFEDLMEKEVLSENPLLENEQEIVKRARDAMNKMAEELTGLAEIPYGLNELAYLVYDPLPAAVTVCIPKAAEEVEGFVAKGDLCYSIPRRGMIEAFEALDGRWVSPDPFVTWIRIHRSQGQEKLDLAGFAAKRRSATSVPTARAILEALEGRMRHESSYRLRWIEIAAEDRKVEAKE